MQAWAGKCSEKYWSEEKLKNNGCFIFDFILFNP